MATESVLIITAVGTLLVAVLAQLSKSRCTDIECSDCLKIKRKVDDITEMDEINKDKSKAVNF